MAGAYHFDRFLLDPLDRRLSEDGRPVELSGRYLDALVLLVAEEGRLVTKARFLDEVWKGVPVTEEALTQCVRSLRRVLGDEAGRPRFIETVPRHGYRFIASVTRPEVTSTKSAAARSEIRLRPERSEAFARFVDMGRAGLIGGGAGGAVSGLLVLAALTALVGMIGGAGVGFGVGAARFLSRRHKPSLLVGGAGGGLVVGAIVRLVGLDAFSLLFGSAPGAMTGAGEGVLLGAAIGAGVWIAQGRRWRIAVLTGGVLTAAAGAGAALSGGRLMGGSLAALAAQFPAARLRLDHLGALFGESTFGPVSQAATAGLEGAVFGAAMVLALSSQRRQLNGSAGSERAVGPPEGGAV